MHQRHAAVVSLRYLYDLRGATACLCTGVRGGCTRGGGGEALKCTAHPHRGPTLTVSHILHRTRAFQSHATTYVHSQQGLWRRVLVVRVVAPQLGVSVGCLSATELTRDVGGWMVGAATASLFTLCRTF